MKIKIYILLISFVFFKCNGIQKNSQNSKSEITDSANLLVTNKEKSINTIQIEDDSLINLKHFTRYFQRWYDFQKSLNQGIVVDSFKRKYENTFELVNISYDYTNVFDTVYHNYLSYSPDKTKIVDLFSNQIELYELSNGKFGGLFTLSVKPFLIIPAKKEKYILNIFTELDQFHDWYWIDNDILLLIGSTNINLPNDYSRIYRLWVVDLKNNIYRVYDNKNIRKYIYIDFYVNHIIFRDAEISLD